MRELYLRIVGGKQLPVPLIFGDYLIDVYHIPGTDEVGFIGSRQFGSGTFFTTDFNAIPGLTKHWIKFE